MLLFSVCIGYYIWWLLKKSFWKSPLWVHCIFLVNQLFVDFNWTFSTGWDAVLRPCLSRKARDLPRNNLMPTECPRDNHCLLQLGISFDMVRAPHLSFHLHLKGRSDGKPGKSACITLCCMTMVDANRIDWPTLKGGNEVFWQVFGQLPHVFS